MIDKLEAIERRHGEITERLFDPAVLADPTEYQRVARLHAELNPAGEEYHRLRKLLRQMEDARGLLRETVEPEMRELAAAELDDLQKRREALEASLEVMLLPRDPADDRNIILEIRAGAGGEEAGLFAAELLRMYTRYAETRRWRVETIAGNSTGIGGIRDAICTVEGRAAYSRLKFESGVHRVQRVPATEASGRIHTSTVTVAVLPEAEEVDVQIGPNDLRIDVFRSTGPGGQSVNTTDSAVRITHVPTGLVVTCQDEKSQHKNKAKALKVLRARLYDQELQRQKEAIDKNRRTQVGSGERAEKIRTYNFPQNRVTDHRIGLTVHNLSAVLEGDLDDLIQALATHDQAERLKALA
ncbi:MAG: peptide chain release factor 1 [candidate division NC10 bacterium RBG_16_65_8]|nr:MAG: peptide chain release factor 1 [candidate division NC10 bacterium RBG_16_65_8]